MVKFNGINHLAMVTSDMDKTIRFWRDLIGMRLIARLGRPGFRQYFFQISDNDMLTFFEWEGAGQMKEKDHGMPVKGPIIFDHVSFGVEDDEELWELKDKLDAAGFYTTEIIDHGFIHSIYSFDPNGIPIEFSTNVAGRNIRKKPVSDDKSPTEITLEGSEPVPNKWPKIETPTQDADKIIIPGVGSDLFD